MEDNNQTSEEAIIIAEPSRQGGEIQSTCCQNDCKAEASSAVTSDSDANKTLELADELIMNGSKLMKEADYVEATESFSRALEIKVGHYGELAPECVVAYYKYGCALLSKAQEEADPLGAVPKKEAESAQDSVKDESIKTAPNDEASIASVSSNVAQEEVSDQQESTVDDVSNLQDQENGEGSDTEDVAEDDEDDSDLDLAWKMLDIARAIVEKHSDDTMVKVDILSALAEVALEREDVETSLSDYLKALSILERLVEPDSRLLAELNFRVCLCLEIGSKAEEALPYCQKAISICKSRMQRLKDEISKDVGQSSGGTETDNVVPRKEDEIETLTSLASDLEKKLEDLQQLVSNPTSVLSEILGMMSAKAKGVEKSSSSAIFSSSCMGTVNTGNGELDSPTVSTAHTNGAATASGGVTHLGVVGRGVKRVLMNSGASAAESVPTKKPSLDNADGSSS